MNFFSNLFGQSEIMNMMPTIITVNKCRFQTKIQLMLLHHSTYILTTALLTESLYPGLCMNQLDETHSGARITLKQSHICRKLIIYPTSLSTRALARAS